MARLGRALYSRASLLNNSCVPSVVRQWGGWGELRLVTARAVARGEQLTICYTGLLQPTRTRQLVFSQTKHFTCGCARCRDPTELGTHLGSVLCGCGAAVSPAQDKCAECGRGVAREEAAAVLERCDALVGRLGPATDCLVWCSLGRKLAALLPTNNYIFAQVIILLLSIVGYNG